MTSLAPQEESAQTGLLPPALLESLQGLVTSLREELQQYGELLALLDRQQEFSGVWSAEQWLQSIAAVQGQAARLETARGVRDQFQGAVATFLEQSPDVPFTVLIPRLPADYRPLVEALASENCQLLRRIQKRALQNQASMKASVARMQQFVRSLPTLRRSDTALLRHPAPLATAVSTTAS